MNTQRLLAWYCNESTLVQSKFLAYFGHQVTIFIRNFYVLDGNVNLNQKQFQCVNEIMHRIFSQQFKLLSDDKERYPDDLLIKMIFSMASECDFESQLLLCAEDSYKYSCI